MENDLYYCFLETSWVVSKLGCYEHPVKNVLPTIVIITELHVCTFHFNSVHINEISMYVYVHVHEWSFT